MASIEMKNLRSFPMEKLCFDLKLEALEQMEPRHVYELAKVNQGFQGMLVRNPSIVFGEHVYRIRLFNDTIWIDKFPNSYPMANVDHPFHFSFIKKIRSCDQLSFEMNHPVDKFVRDCLSFWMNKFNKKYTLLKNLKSVNRLQLGWNSKKALEIFFSTFHASIKKDALLKIESSALNDQVIKDWIENFMMGAQLKDCGKISFMYLTEEAFRFCYNALLKSEIKNVYMRTLGWMDLIIQQIITNGIPSKNPEAAIFLDSDDIPMDLSQYPGMRRIDGENRLRLLKQANDLVMIFGCSDSHGFRFFTEESSIFRQRFDSGKDCICMYKYYTDTFLNEYTDFLAFYVPVN